MASPRRNPLQMALHNSQRGKKSLGSPSNSTNAANASNAANAANQSGSGGRGVMYLKLFGLSIAVYAILTLVWEHAHLNSADSMEAMIRLSKENFVGVANAVGLGNVGGSYGGDQTSISGEGGIVGGGSDPGAIVPIDLSVNHLKLLPRAPGAPPTYQFHPNPNQFDQFPGEDFLPIVTRSEITFRWRHAFREGGDYDDARVIRGYQVIVREGGSGGSGGKILWDSNLISLPPNSPNDGPPTLPTSVPYGGPPPPLGAILHWQVQIHDGKDRIQYSNWSKFGVGPEQSQSAEFNGSIQTKQSAQPGQSGQTGQSVDNINEWKGTWIVHPSDMNTFDKSTPAGNLNSRNECDGWKLRRPLPLFRLKLTADDLRPATTNTPTNGTGKNGAADRITSALLVVAGLGSFRTSLDGIPLSSSGPIDPAFTDYSKRVSYRGYDVTSLLKQGDTGSGGNGEHVVGVTMGSGWWDHRPISGMAKPKLLPRGPATIMAQLILTFASGEIKIVGETNGLDDSDNQSNNGGSGNSVGGWQVTRGHIRESDLFTGETIDLNVFDKMEGWDTSQGWNEVTGSTNNNNDNSATNDNHDPFQEVNAWIAPTTYRTDITGEQRRQKLAIQAKAMEASQGKRFEEGSNFAAPIGRLIPSEVPPVMPMERIPPDEIHPLGTGRWLLDYGKAMSGMIHFDDGLPPPIVPPPNSNSHEGTPMQYPRGHGFHKATEKGDSFLTVIYGESLEMTTGDINRVLVAGLGLHDGGPRHVSKKKGQTDNAFCFPEDHDGILSQRDVYVIPKEAKVDENGLIALYSKVRQSHFTTHSFRFAEVCCTATPPTHAHALLYRTAVPQWGSFDSSNINVNGGYELVRNAMQSNMLSVQSDCPHREKLPYGGDLVADSPAALHMFDMSSFYLKTIRDWMDAQWDNGAYTETSIWQDLNDYAGIGHGAGETVWATAPPVLTVRHMQHYGDLQLLHDSIDHHIQWLEFLNGYFDEGMLKKGYDPELNEYTGQKSGLGDWLAMRSRDTYLTHTAFYMAAGRCVAYIARQLSNPQKEELGLSVAKKIQDRIVHLYLKNGKDNFDFPKGSESHTPGPEMSLFSKIVPGPKRCVVLKNWFRRSGHTWPGDEEMRFLRELGEEEKNALVETGEISKRGNQWAMGWSQWQGFNEGIFAIRYSMKTLSSLGYHHIALRKAAGFGFGTPEYMMSHNATTFWESWWRSEDLYSRNHPMLGAVAEWMPSAAAGVELDPKTVGGKTMVFWPRFPKSARTMEYASALQGTPKGDFAIAWRFEDLPSDESKYDSAVVRIRIRMLIPPSGEGVLRFPIPPSSAASATLRHASIIPDLSGARSMAASECESRRKRRLGFPYSWEYNREKSQWYKLESGKAIGTPCKSFLFHTTLDGTRWGEQESVPIRIDASQPDVPLTPGLYEVLITNWQLEKEVEGTGRIGNLPEYYKASENDLGPYCKDETGFEWDIYDATHII